MKSKVYYSKKEFDKILEYLPSDLKGKIGIKVHFGEMGNTTHLKPAHAKKVFNKLTKNNSDVSLVECNVLYRGSRSNEEDHLETAKKHGFDFAPVDICDGETGADSWEIPTGQKHFKSIFVGMKLKNYKNLIVLSHFKGHTANGFGGALKNLGMGLGSRTGKMAMHAAFNLTIDKNKCIGCGVCASGCGGHAITIIEGKVEIDFKKCLHCAGCITACRQGAVMIPWGDMSSPKELQERIAEYCLGISKNINCPFYINVLENITPECDCFGVSQKSISPDLGFLASADPVALDQASLDLLKKSLGKDAFFDHNKVDSSVQLEYGKEIGLGSRDYDFVDIG